MIQEPSIASDQLQREAAKLGEEDAWRNGLPPALDSNRAEIEPRDYGMSRLFETALPDANRFRRTTRDGLLSVTREQLAVFYRTHYRPDKLILVIAGDVSTFATLVDIQRRYGEFGVTRPTSVRAEPPANGEAKSRAPVATKPSSITVSEAARFSQPARNPETPQLRYANDRGDIMQSIVTLGFRGPGGGSADWPAVEVLSALLGQGRGSRLYRSLLAGQPALSRVESLYHNWSDEGLLTTQMWVDPQGIDKAESLAFRELDRVRRELATEAEIARAHSILERRMLRETATFLGRARMLARFEAAGAGYRAALDYRTRIRSVKAQDVQRVASRFIRTPDIAVHEYEARNAPPRSFDSERFAATVSAWAPSLLQSVDGAKVLTPDASNQLPVVDQPPDRSSAEQASIESMEALPLKDFSTLNGPRAFVREDHATPLVTVALLFQGGRVTETETTSGMTELMLQSLLYGTGRQSPLRVADELEQLGSEIEVVVEPDFFGLVLSSVARNSERALKLVRDFIEEPAFRDEDIARARQVHVGIIREERGSGRERSRALFLQALFPGNPYSFDAHGREEVIAKATSEQVRAWYERTIKRQAPLAVIIGDTDGSALVSSHLAEGFRRRELDKTLALRIPEPGKPGEKVESAANRYSVATIGVNGPRGNSTDLAVLAVIEASLNGAGGELLPQLKDKPSFAYDVKLAHEALLAAGIIYFDMVTSPENEARARTLLTGEIERIVRTGLTPDQLAAATGASSLSLLATLQSPEVRALKYARAFFYRQQPGEVDLFADRISRATADDIKRVAALYFKPAGMSAGVARGSSPSSR
jgi:zinc protease